MSIRSFDPHQIFREELGELKAYTPSSGSYELRLDANEAPQLLPAELHKKLADVAGKVALNRYPDGSVRSLRKALAKKHGVKSNQIITGVGSDEIITMLLTAATRLKSRAPVPTLVTTTPTFVMYRLSARVRGQRVMEVPLDAEWDLDERAMSRAIEMAEPNVIFIATPNNPTGTMVSEERLVSIIEQAENSLVVVDEAYIDYSDRDQTHLLSRYENVAILRTLSKVGFAALRVGWMVASEALISELDKVRLPYNMPTLSQELATTVVANYWEEVEHMTAQVVSERERVGRALDAMGGLEVTPSQANFLWVQTERPAGELHAALAKMGVLIRSFHGRGGRLEHYLRVTIGAPNENDHFLRALESVL